MFVSYVELHCHSAFSFLDGASHPVELAAAAVELGHETLALTDHDGLHGAMEFAQAARAYGLRPVTGAELTLDDDSHLTLLCESKVGYSNLCRLITKAHARTRRWAGEWDGEVTVERLSHRRQDPIEGEPRVAIEDLERHAEGLVCLSGCARDGAVARRLDCVGVA